MIEIKRPRVLEQELYNIVHNFCPGKNWDAGFEAYGCVVDGEVCTYSRREDCEKYKLHILPRRQAVLR